MQSHNLSAHASYNPYGPSGQPMPVSEPFLVVSTPKPSKETEAVQQQFADGNSFLILEAEAHAEKFIDFSFMIGEKTIEAIALISEPKRFQSLKTNNILSVYLFTKDSNSTNAGNRLDVEPAYMEAFKQKIIDAISGATKPLKDLPTEFPNNSGRSFRTKSLHAEVTPMLAV